MELHNTARSLLEDIGSRLGVMNNQQYVNLGLDLSSKSVNCPLNGACKLVNENRTLEEACFTADYFNATRCDIASQGYYCCYCLIGQKLIPNNSTSNCTCSSGYPIYVDYDFYFIKDELGLLMGVAVCLRTRFIDPYFNQSNTTQFKEYRKLILNTGIF